MGKDEQVAYWVKAAEEDWTVAEELLNLGRFTNLQQKNIPRLNTKQLRS
jgi:hypothetical protein